MSDLTNKELLIPFGTYQDMVSRTNTFKDKNKKNPNIVFLNIKNKKDHVSYSRLTDMYQRVKAWKADKSNGALKNVWIKKPKNTTNVLKPAGTYPTVNIKGKKYTPKNFTEFYMLMGGTGYAYYYNDIYTLSQEIKNLSNGKAMNCSDLSQLGVYVASQYKKDNKTVYQTRYRHVDCKSGGGHTQFEIKGGEFSKWTVIDLAAKSDKNSRVYPLGDGWCMNGRVRGYNESWILKDDGKT